MASISSSRASPGRSPTRRLRSGIDAHDTSLPARYLESLEDPELPGLLATHYLAAYQNTPAGPDADALAARARVSLRAAAERAASLGSRAKALGYLRDAIAITGDADERALLEERGGIAAADKYVDEAVLALFGRHRARVRAGPLARAARTLARIRCRLQLQRAERRRRSIASKPGLSSVGTNDDEGHARLFAELARGYMLDYRSYEEVSKASDRALAIARPRRVVPVMRMSITKGTALIRDHARRGWRC